ncbi:MAG: DNA internalization-related competence protein ComEC/Rec2, partial [Clostridia bacterium]|nr:DNA internalization-related competence protein ComEC/Rec2 [Clostridia bacterium]
DAALPSSRAALVRALALGDRRALSADASEALRRSGLAHLLSVSGLHVAFVIGAAAAVVRAASLPAPLAAALPLSAAAVYALLVGAEVPVARASLSAAAAVLGRLAGRPADPLQALALAFLVILIADPRLVAAIGLQLSFLATLGILVAVRRFPPRGGLQAALRVSLAAQVATAPVLAANFGSVSPAGLVANLAAVPLAATVVVLGLGGAAVGALAAPLHLDPLSLTARLALWPAGAAADLLTAVARTAAAWPGAALPVPSLPQTWYAAWYAGWVAAVTDGGARRRLALVAAALVAVGAFTTWHPAPPGPPPLPARGQQDLRAVFLDVGQGDAAVLHLPGGRTVVVDAGPEGPDGGGAVTRYLRRAGVRQIDLLVLTHGDADHAGGGAALLAAFPVQRLWLGAWSTGDPAVPPLRAAAAHRGLTLTPPAPGTVLRPAPGVVLEVLQAPPAPGGPVRPERQNDGSIVLRVRYGLASFLFTGDLETGGEAVLLASGRALASTVLKAAHHGSDGSSGRPFLAAVRPRLVVVSVGPNPWGLPRPAALARLAETGARILRTDHEGAVVVDTDGRRMRWTSMRSLSTRP